MEAAMFQICTEKDQPKIIRFLESVKADFDNFDRQAVTEMTQLLYQHGGIIGGYKQQEMIGMLGYFLGEPSRNYRNKEVGFVYITALAQKVRRTGVARQGLWFTMQTMQGIGIERVRFHARKTDPYTNGLYSHFARCIGEEQNRRGYTCNLYEASVSEVLADQAARQRIRAKQPTPDNHQLSRQGFRRTQGF